MTRLLVVGALFTLAASEPLQAGSKPTCALLAAEDGYIRAITSRDDAALAATLSDDLVYIHVSGAAEDKRQYLKGTVDGGFRVVGARIVERHASVFGSIGTIYGTIAYDVGAGENAAGYLAVYRRERGRWLLLRWQNARRAGK